VGHLKIILVILIGISVSRCGSLLGDSYDEDVANDRAILEEIIEINPILDSVPTEHRFLSTDPESGKLSGDLILSGLGLNDSNFQFPKSIQNFRLINTAIIGSNNFIDLPNGIKNKNWSAILVHGNRMCQPSAETIDFLDKLMKGYPGGYWRDTQRCDDTIPAEVP
jgi:hypothetical protein